MAHLEDVFSTALHLQPPWHISDAKFFEGKKSLNKSITGFIERHPSCRACQIAKLTNTSRLQ